MSTANVQNQITVLGKQFTQNRTITTDGAVLKDPTLAAAKTGALTTRTDNNTGTFTMDSGHGLVTSDVCSVFWDGGARYGMTATVTGDSVVLDAGGGDNLPVVDTDVTVMKEQSEAFVATAASVQSLLANVNGGTSGAWAVFYSDTPAVIKACYMDGSEDAYSWNADDPEPASTPLGDDIATVSLSHGDSSASRVVTALALVN